jgi:hypothetical protein
LAHWPGEPSGGRSLSPVARVRVEEHSRIGRRVNDSSDNVLEAWGLLRRLDSHGARSPRHKDIGGNDRLAKHLSVPGTSTFVRDRLSGQQHLSWKLFWVSCAYTHNFCVSPTIGPSDPPTNVGPTVSEQSPEQFVGPTPLSGALTRFGASKKNREAAFVSADEVATPEARSDAAPRPARDQQSFRFCIPDG